MTNRRKVDMGALVDEMGAVAAFASNNISMTQPDSNDRSQQKLFNSLLLSPMASPTHDRRTLANGELDVAVGWDVEPPIEGQKNAAFLRVMRAHSNPSQPIEGVDLTLRVRVHQETDTREFPLRAVHGQRGEYVADFIPTRAGNYRFTFVGTIEDHSIYEVFDSADGAFSIVRSIAELGFPPPVIGVSETPILPCETCSSAMSTQVLAATGFSIAVVSLLIAIKSYRARSRSKRAAAAVSEDVPD
jgi:hypothetical protein